MLVRRMSFLFLALLISGGTIIAAQQWLRAQRPVVVAPVVEARPTPMVLTARIDLPAGQFVRAEHLHWQAWPTEGILPNYILQGSAKLEDYVGAVVRTGLTAGEPIVLGRVVRPGERGFMAAVLTPGYRAVTVPVTASSGNAGFVFPGDRVDVLLTYAVPNTGEKERHASETVLRDIRVLAVDQRSDDQRKEAQVAKTATIEVTPKQAEVVAVTSELGKLSLSLRSLARQEDAPQADAHTYTWDSDATLLMRVPRGGAARKISVVRGTDTKDISVGGGQK